jgi:hypothetical protein
LEKVSFRSGPVAAVAWAFVGSAAGDGGVTGAEAVAGACGAAVKEGALGAADAEDVGVNDSGVTTDTTTRRPRLPYRYVGLILWRVAERQSLGW